MRLYHKDSTEPVDCHPTQVETMKRRGWVEDPPPEHTTSTVKPDGDDEQETEPAD